MKRIREDVVYCQITTCPYKCSFHYISNLSLDNKEEMIGYIQDTKYKKCGYNSGYVLDLIIQRYSPENAIKTKW